MTATACTSVKQKSWCQSNSEIHSKLRTCSAFRSRQKLLKVEISTDPNSIGNVHTFEVTTCTRKLLPSFCFSDIGLSAFGRLSGDLNSNALLPTLDPPLGHYGNQWWVQWTKLTELSFTCQTARFMALMAIFSYFDTDCRSGFRQFDKPLRRWVHFRLVYANDRQRDLTSSKVNHLSSSCRIDWYCFTWTRVRGYYYNGAIEPIMTKHLRRGLECIM